MNAYLAQPVRKLTTGDFSVLNAVRSPIEPTYIVPDFSDINVNIASFLPRCMECRLGLAMRILSVRPSVCQTRDL